jgi:hypothetical protein
MPYYLYRIGPFGQLHKLDEFENFKAASAQAKALRSAAEAPRHSRIKVMFAANEQLAEELLCQVREAPPAGDE